MANGKTATSGIVEIHGRQYETVALRVQKFREKHPGFTLKTNIIRLDQEEVLIEAQILDDTGRLIANGHAQEFRQSSQINRTSYVENCETSAIGRALAAFGLSGSEFATADELANAISNKREPQGLSSEELASVSVKLEEAARRGTKALQEAWGAIPTPAKVALRELKESLKHRAADFDLQRAA